MYTQRLYRKLAQTLHAWQNCKGNNREWEEKHAETLKDIEGMLPSGSGFDSGTKIDMDRSNPNKIILTTSYHHMNDGGYYDGWTEHEVIITPSLEFGFDIRITGKNRNDIKDYMGDIFAECLGAEFKE